MNTLEPAAICAFLSDKLLAGRAVGPDDELLLSGLLDSLGVMSLVAELERRRGAPIPAQDVTIENFESVATICAYLGRG